jgi:arylsulfatase A-like enzyme
MPGQPDLAKDVVTIAEHLSAAGYETVGISENLVASDIFQLLQGFARRWATTIDENREVVKVDANQAVRAWLADRQSGRPFFLFVNIFDPHEPYTVRASNPFVAPDATRAEIQSRAPRSNSLLCGGLPTEREIDILRGLYLGDVADADRETAEILKALRDHLGDSELLSIVTSDHGEYFGKRKLMGHLFGLNESVLRIPMIVHGRTPQGSARIEEPVGLIDIAPTILGWAGLEAPAKWHGRPLPDSAPPSGERRPPRALTSAFSDQFTQVSKEWEGRAEFGDPAKIRQFCSESDPVWGGMAALIRYPYKFHWFEKYPPELYDLSWDSQEQSNQARMQPDLVEEFTRQIEEIVAGAGVRHDANTEPTELSEDAREALKALGYAD